MVVAVDGAGGREHADTTLQCSANSASSNGTSGGESYPPVDVVVAARSGSVLLRNTVLKSDYFPGCQNKRLTPLLEGAPNFRQVPNLPVYGVAIPTTTGVRLVLDALGASNGGRQVHWHNMREEPVLYINGRPYVVREADSPFANLEYTGITQARVEAMEARLKEDVLREAARYNNHILVAYEGDDFQVLEEWEPVTEHDVQTPLEVYQELTADGYKVDYLRVPVTDEKAPKEADCDLLVKRVWRIAGDYARTGTPGAPPAIVFNCQMGRGRTTTGMVITSMLLLRRLSDEAPDSLPDWYDVRRRLCSPPAGQLGAAFEEEALKAGKWGVIRSLLRVLDRGAASKAVLDLTLDACSAMQNLREAIAVYRGRLIKERNDAKREALLNVIVEYLERYYVLIALSEFMLRPAFDPDAPDHVTFADWSAQRPELKSILRRMLRRNPLAALDLHRPDALAAGDANGSLGGAGGGEDAGEDEWDLRLAARSGAVLGPHTILKDDHFPGCHSSKLPQLVAGAPNLREVAGMNIWGMALPTADGLRAVMRRVGVQSSHYTPRSKLREAVWVNMREEASVYINGRPFVLREDERPFKNLQEYSGIGSERLELMEQRLKEDVLREAAAFEGRVLVAREAAVGHAMPGGGGGGGSVVETGYETITGPAAVQTPSEMAAALVSEGYALRYFRVPMTDGTPPKPSDFDTFAAVVGAAAPGAPLVFNCQMGVGRTTCSLVIACMLRHHMGVPLSSRCSRSMSELSLRRGDSELEGLSPKMVSGQSDDEDEDSSPRRLVGSVWREAAEAEGLAADLAAGGVEGPLARGVSSELEEEEERLRNGDYVGVRRFTRMLEFGEQAKQAADLAVNACSAVINLRTAIMRYRTPRSRFRFYRPELHARDTEYKRGIAYLERYCLLIAFQSYLTIHSPEQGQGPTFSEWLAARPDVHRALASLSQNPTTALAPVPSLPALAHVPAFSGDRTLHTTKSVLRHRGGGTLSTRSILKSTSVKNGAYNPLHLPGLDDVRRADGLPVYTIGNCSVAGLRALLDGLGAGPSGDCHVLFADVREELVAYVGGQPFLRRELEMPSAALHHAGIRAVKLEELERRLLTDVASEAQLWDGKILLHREEHVPAEHANGTASAPSSSPDGKGTDDVTRMIDRPAPLVAYWQPAGEWGDPDAGLCTARQVFAALAAEGYSLAYRRVPLSRERTPEAADVDAMLSLLKSEVAGRHTVHAVLSRTATGSSCRFAAALISLYLMPHVPRAPANAHAEAALQEADSTPLDRLTSLRGEYRGIMNLCRVLPNGLEAKSLADAAVDACQPVGNLRHDIYACKEVVEGRGAGGTRQQLEVSAARQQGLHYLRRYFFLVAFRAYLETCDSRVVSFLTWFNERQELKYLLSTLEL